MVESNINRQSSQITVPITANYGPWHIQCSGKAVGFTKRFIEQVAGFVLANHKVKRTDVTIDIVLCSVEEMTIYSKQYLDKDEPTDTISLSSGQPVDSDFHIILGTVFLCLPIIAKNADDLGVPPTCHIAHITVHSVLHLLGYLHDEEEDIKQMEAKEIIILSKLGVPNPYMRNREAE